MTKKLALLITVFVLASFSLACQTPADAPPAPTENQPATTNTETTNTIEDSSDSGTPIEAAAPEAGKGAITGRALFLDINEPASNIPVQLAEIIRQNGQEVFILDIAQSPYTETNSAGYFAFENVEPGDYAVSVGNVEANQYAVWADSNDVAIIITVEDGLVKEIGEVTVMPIEFYTNPQPAEPADAYPAPDTTDPYPDNN